MRTWMYVVGLVCQVSALGYLYYYGKNGLCDVYALQHDISAIETQEAELNAQIAELSSDIELWNSDSFYKEKIAREQLHMARSGDIVYYR